MDKSKNKLTGNYGEDLATQYLEGNGYRILQRNLRLSCGEIDILAKQNKTIVIVEVKTVKGEKFGYAKDLVRFKKQQKLKLLAGAITQEYPKSNIRIDVIGVDLTDPSQPVFEHIVNAVN